MSSTPQDNENQPGTAERRLNARRRVMSLAYIDLGGSNGGIIVDIGEDGLEVAAAAPMELGPLPRMRFQMPESSDWVEADGEITWVSESKKEASVRFANLAEDTRNRIRNWVSAEAPTGESKGQISRPFEEERRPSGPPPDRALVRPVLKFTAMSAKAQEEILAPASVAEADASMRETGAPAASPAPAEVQFLQEDLPHPWDPVADHDRRQCARRHLASLAYIGLGGSNGGIILNMSEGGVVVATAAPVEEGPLPKLRFQLPGSSDWIEASGEIAWISNSKREMGIRFVDLSPDARDRIKGWVSSKGLPAQPQAERPKEAERPRRVLAMPDLRPGRGMPIPHVHSEPIVQVRAPFSALNARTPATLKSATARVTAPSTPIAAPSPSMKKEIALDAAAGERPPHVVALWRSWWSLVIAVVSLSFFVGWFSAGPTVHNKMVAALGRKPAESTEPAASEKPQPVDNTANALTAPAPDAESQGLAATRPSARNNTSVPSTPTSNAPTRTRSIAPASTNILANVPGASMTNPHQQKPTAEPRSISAAGGAASSQVVSVPPRSASVVPAQPKEVAAAVPTPKVNQPEPERPTEATGKESPPPPKPAENPDVFKGSVSVSFSPYQSIRVPAELRSQMAKQGASLQIGQLISRVDPVYPEDAEKHRIEGIVKLRVIIGPDGAVESVGLISGPESFVPAAVSAARQWRYKSASVAGQPVEAEQDITVVFRLVKQAAHPN